VAPGELRQDGQRPNGVPVPVTVYAVRDLHRIMLRAGGFYFRRVLLYVNTVGGSTVGAAAPQYHRTVGPSGLGHVGRAKRDFSVRFPLDRV